MNPKLLKIFLRKRRKKERERCKTNTESIVFKVVNAHKDVKQSELSYHHLVPLGIYRKELKIHVHTSTFTKMA